MHHTLTRLIILPLLVTFCVVSTLTPAAQATVIDTRTLLSVEADSPQSDVQSFLARKEVREQMVLLGVDPDDASNRVAALTEQELSQLQHHISDLPAGSNALALIGAVFLVLIILELVGVTNIFNKL